MENYFKNFNINFKKFIKLAPWLFFTAITLFNLLIGIILYVNRYIIGSDIIIISFGVLGLMVNYWFISVEEAELEGRVSKQAIKDLNWDIIWNFTTLEVWVIVGYAWAYYYYGDYDEYELVSIYEDIRDNTGDEILMIIQENKDWLYSIKNIIIAIIIVLCVLLIVAYAILLERKVLGSIQRRRGPNLVGFLGLLQPIADAVKLIVKETIIPLQSNGFIFILAPLLTLILSLLNWSLIPFSSHGVLADIRVSILMFFALSSLTVYGIIMSGWSSNSKYAFLGALRAAAQVIAYEVCIGLTLIYILIQSKDLNYFEIIWRQGYIWNIIPCFIFFLLFLISTLAETNRPPFDLPEAEAELVAGYNVEYSAMSFGFFFLGEYVNIWTVCSINVILYWGGFLIWGYESIFFFSIKVIILVITFIWVRASLPRYRYDQLMRLGWKILLPISLGFVVLYIGIYYSNLFSFLEELPESPESLDESPESLDESPESLDESSKSVDESPKSLDESSESLLDESSEQTKD